MKVFAPARAATHLTLLLLLACSDPGHPGTSGQTPPPSAGAGAPANGSSTNGQTETNRQPRPNPAEPGNSPGHPGTPGEVVANGTPPDVNGQQVGVDPNHVDVDPVDVDPLADLAEADLLAPGVEGAGAMEPVGPLLLTAEQRATHAPAHHCVTLAPRAARISTERGPAIVRAGGDAFLVAGYAQTAHGPQVYAIRVQADGHTQPLFTAPLTPSTSSRPTRLPTVPPGLEVQGDRALLVWVDGDRLRAAPLAVSAWRGARLLDLGQGADARFSPAVALRPQAALVAYTDGSATPMHVRLLRVGLGGDVEARADVTPQGFGAAAPTFAVSTTSESPQLYFLEPRSGTSALYRVEFDADLGPRPATLVRPINSVYEPPRLAVVRSTPGAVAYTALGNAATTAIGLLPLADASTPPVALLRGSGFGLFGLDVAALPGAALFAFGAPIAHSTAAPGAAPPSHAVHEIHVRLAAPGPMPELVIARQGGAEAPSIAVGPDGLIALTYAAPGGVYLNWLSCTP